MVRACCYGYLSLLQLAGCTAEVLRLAETDDLAQRVEATVCRASATSWVVPFGATVGEAVEYIEGAPLHYSFTRPRSGAVTRMQLSWELQYGFCGQSDVNAGEPWNTMVDASDGGCPRYRLKLGRSTVVLRPAERCVRGETTPEDVMDWVLEHEGSLPGLEASGEGRGTSQVLFYIDELRIAASEQCKPEEVAFEPPPADTLERAFTEIQAREALPSSGWWSIASFGSFPSHQMAASIRKLRGYQDPAPICRRGDTSGFRHFSWSPPAIGEGHTQVIDGTLSSMIERKTESPTAPWAEVRCGCPTQPEDESAEQRYAYHCDIGCSAEDQTRDAAVDQCLYVLKANAGWFKFVCEKNCAVAMKAKYASAVVICRSACCEVAAQQYEGEVAACGRATRFETQTGGFIVQCSDGYPAEFCPATGAFACGGCGCMNQTLNRALAKAPRKSR